MVTTSVTWLLTTVLQTGQSQVLTEGKVKVPESHVFYSVLFIVFYCLLEHRMFLSMTLHTFMSTTKLVCLAFCVIYDLYSGNTVPCFPLLFSVRTQHWRVYDTVIWSKPTYSSHWYISIFVNRVSNLNLVVFIRVVHLVACQHYSREIQFPHLFTLMEMLFMCVIGPLLLLCCCAEFCWALVYLFIVISVLADIHSVILMCLCSSCWFFVFNIYDHI